MSNRKLSLQGFFRKLGSLYRKITKSSVNRVLRYVLLYQRRGKLSTAGFILPTTVLLILVVALTVGALTFRAYNRNIQVIGDAQQRVIYNAATPAIDRARSKLEFLFDSTKDTRLPSGVPSQSTLQAMLLNNGTSLAVLPYKDPATGNQTDAYTFPDETRIDINKDGTVDNAWYFRADTNGDGVINAKDSITIYSISLNTPPATSTQSIQTLLLQKSAQDKANNLWVRQAPLSVDGAIGCATNTSGGSAGPDGWFNDKISTAKLRKNFQVDALVLPGNSGGTKATLEFTQDRQLDRGNKWGAWFRHDLEIYPGPQFNWNGAMHTEGSLLIGGTSFSAYLISAPSSCLYNPPVNSEISTTDQRGTTQTTNLLGLVGAGVVKDGTTGGSSTIHLHSSNPTANNSQAPLNTSTASLKSTANPFDVTIDPATVVQQNGYTNVAPPPGTTKADRNNRTAAYLNSNKATLPDFKNPTDNSQRISATSQAPPYVDDLYRADDRWGPKPQYKGNFVPDGQFGQIIDPNTTTSDVYQQMVANTVAPGDTDAANVGLDGYWERRARAKGLRILVGQRLELGNLFTWYAPIDKGPIGPDGYVGYTGTATNPLDQGTSTTGYEYEGDPLYPPTVRPYPVTSSGTFPSGLLSHVDQQRRTLRDNLSAVQSTAIYHASANPNQLDYPVACLATTSHPGTLWTIRQALTFRPFSFTGTDQNGVPDTSPTSLLTNFFTGLGTNGWEFAPPAGDINTYTTQISNPTSSLRIALQNLANFAGDHQTINGTLKSGAFPPTPNDPDKFIHPYPALSMWGDYSNLKRALATLSANSNDPTKLSVADQTYLQTAACTLGMLAYNVDKIQKFDPSAGDGTTTAANDRRLLNIGNQTLMAKLGRDLFLLMNGKNDGATSADPEVLPKEQLSTYDYSATGLPGVSYPIANKYNLKDYQNVTPEAFIAALRQYLLKNLKPDDPNFIDEMRMAEMIMLNHQIRRDRTFGFKPSPRFGTYSIITPLAGKKEALPTACDPDQFVFTNTTLGDTIFTRQMQSSSTISKASTVFDATNPNKWIPNSTGFSTPRDLIILNANLALSQYRLALSRLCGTIDSSGSQVLPKFPTLYYLFPEVAHDYDGANDTTRNYDHTQPGTGASAEPYIADSYIKLINAQFQSGSLPFQPISTTVATGRAGSASVPFDIPDCSNPNTSACQAYAQLSRNPDPDSPGSLKSIRVFPIADLSVSSIVLNPNLGTWNLPKLSSPKPFDTTNFATGNDKANFSTNIILDGTSSSGANATLTPTAVPFLDRAFFDGRQLMMVRTLDLDIGLLRSTRLGTANDVWLPVSGVVYAFREDAVREDMISRPACTGSNCTMNVQDPFNPVDSSVLPVNTTRTTLNPGENGISLKAIDLYPDPDRRVRGFRLRNGVQTMRNRSFEGTGGFINAADNNKGLSFFTDQPVYIQGSFNLHQDGSDDTMGTLLEEFTQTIQGSVYNKNDFYGRTTLNPNFATLANDRWRPSEILADSVSILSNGFCDGSIADTFLQYNGAVAQGLSSGSSTYPVPDADVLNMGSPNNNRSYYHNPSIGLFDPGCINSNVTSYHNQNRPAQAMSTKTAGTRSGWDWVRENSRYDGVANRRADTNGNNGHWVDITAPVKISRAGQPLVVRPRDLSPTVDPQPPLVPYGQVLPPIPYNVQFPTQTYYSYGANVNNGPSANNPNTVINALPSQVNTIMVSGITPSRLRQGYGGLHNFPRFLENWSGDNLNFSGSFIQLSYTNYATAPFDLENLDPAPAPQITDPANENIPYYQPPNRLWGYDVALQFSPASPAAARFVNLSKNRSEYYVEPPANDPYIVNLCQAAKSALNLNTSCPGGS